MQPELLRVGILMVSSCHVSGIMYFVVVKLVCVSVVHVSVSIRNISIRGIRLPVISGMEVIFEIQVYIV